MSTRMKWKLPLPYLSCCFWDTAYCQKPVNAKNNESKLNKIKKTLKNKKDDPEEIGNRDVGRASIYSIEKKLPWVNRWLKN